MVRVIKSSRLPKSNISKEERKAIYEMNKGKSIMINGADKGKAVVTVDQKDHNEEVTLHVRR